MLVMDLWLLVVVCGYSYLMYYVMQLIKLINSALQEFLKLYAVTDLVTCSDRARPGSRGDAELLFQWCSTPSEAIGIYDFLIRSPLELLSK